MYSNGATGSKKQETSPPNSDKDNNEDSQATDNSNKFECPICYESINLSEGITTPCPGKHFFCKADIKAWLNTPRPKPSGRRPFQYQCPKCRANLNKEFCKSMLNRNPAGQVPPSIEPRGVELGLSLRRGRLAASGVQRPVNGAQLSPARPWDQLIGGIEHSRIRHLDTLIANAQAHGSQSQGIRPLVFQNTLPYSQLRQAQGVQGQGFQGLAFQLNQPRQIQRRQRSQQPEHNHD
ncbi:hypothetical protein MKZ38_005072 [Zalerion maritima]|uniref:RING-type domain-containing protein n=1 Tax=Zalerion maritima TaxID=339359 RepID=A0AAD5RKT0_9PEZI|nr:hypothetical protein MKZ38_005072 [Zalerion maritima]